MAFRGIDQSFEDTTDDVVVEPGEIEPVDLFGELPPSGYDQFVVKRNARADPAACFAENGFVVAGLGPCGIEKRRKLIDQRVARIDVIVDHQRWKAGKTLPQSIVEYELVGDAVDGKFRGAPKQIGTVADQGPALFIAHPLVECRADGRRLVPVDQCAPRIQDRDRQEAIKCVNEIIVRRPPLDFDRSGKDLDEIEQEGFKPRAHRQLDVRTVQILAPMNVGHAIGLETTIPAQFAHAIGFPKHQLVEVPGEKPGRVRGDRLLAGVDNRRLHKRRRAVVSIRDFDFAGEGDVALAVQDRQVVPF